MPPDMRRVDDLGPASGCVRRLEGSAQIVGKETRQLRVLANEISAHAPDDALFLVQFSPCTSRLQR